MSTVQACEQTTPTEHDKKEENGGDDSFEASPEKSEPQNATTAEEEHTNSTCTGNTSNNASRSSHRPKRKYTPEHPQTKLKLKSKSNSKSRRTLAKKPSGANESSSSLSPPREEQEHDIAAARRTTIPTNENAPTPTTNDSRMVLKVLRGIESPHKSVRRTEVHHLLGTQELYNVNQEESILFWSEFLELAGIQCLLLCIHEYPEDPITVYGACSTLGFCCKYISDASFEKILERRGLKILLRACEYYKNQAVLSLHSDVICIDLDDDNNDDIDSETGVVPRNFSELKAIQGVWEALEGMLSTQLPPNISDQERIVRACFETLDFLRAFPRTAHHAVSGVLSLVFETLTSLLERLRPFPSRIQQFFGKSFALCLQGLTDKDGHFRKGGFRASANAFLSAVDATNHIPKSPADREIIVRFCVDQLKDKSSKDATLFELLGSMVASLDKAVLKKTGLITQLAKIIDDDDDDGDDNGSSSEWAHTMLASVLEG